MKIAQVCPFFYPVSGGMETHVKKISEEMLKKGHEVHVLTSNSLREGKIERRKEVIDGIKVFRFETFFSFGDFGKFWPGFLNKIKNEDYDIVHVHNYRHPHTVLAAELCDRVNIPCVLTTHSPFHPQKLRGPLGIIFTKIYDKIISKFSDRKFSKIITINDSEKNHFRHIDQEKLVTVPNGIDEEIIETTEKMPTEEFKEKFNINDEKIILLMGRIHPTKGIDFFLRAFNRLSDKNLKALILGPIQDESYYRKLKEYIKAKNLEDSVIFTGYVSSEEKITALDISSLFVLPSIYEPFGIVILEAFARGLPVVAAESDGPKYLIKEGENGYLVEFGDIESLKKQMNILLNEERLNENISENNKNKAKKFTWDIVTDKIINIYKEVL